MPKASEKFAALFGHREVLELERDAKDLIDPDQLIGIEIECENAAKMGAKIQNEAVHWNTETDQSLRNNGKEFVLKRPLKGRQLAGAIHEFFEYANNYKLSYNERTSCHIHFDCRNLTYKEFSALLLVYQAVEAAFWTVVNKSRRWSGYCLPMLESQGSAVAAVLAPSGTINAIKMAISEVSRYSALNIQAFPKYGSVEYRHFHNPTEPAQLFGWINIATAIRQVAVEVSKAVGDGVLKAWVEEDPERLIKLVRANPVLAEFTRTIDSATMMDSLDKLLGLIVNPANPRAVPEHLVIELAAPDDLGFVFPFDTDEWTDEDALRFRRLKVDYSERVYNIWTSLYSEDADQTAWVERLSYLLGYNEGLEASRIEYLGRWFVGYLAHRPEWPMNLVNNPTGRRATWIGDVHAAIASHNALARAIPDLTPHQQAEMMAYFVGYTVGITQILLAIKRANGPVFVTFGQWKAEALRYFRIYQNHVRGVYRDEQDVPEPEEEEGEDLVGVYVENAAVDPGPPEPRVAPEGEVLVNIGRWVENLQEQAVVRDYDNQQERFDRLAADRYRHEVQRLRLQVGANADRAGGVPVPQLPRTAVRYNPIPNLNLDN